ncbi:MAG: class I SAM-dependent rRNA methyltransferase [Myxococcota bacterium]
MDELTQSAIPPSLTVKAGHVQPLWAGHPWVFKQAIERVDTEATPGGEVLVIDPHGKILGRGLYSPRSAIAVRLFTSHGVQPVDAELVQARVAAAVALRRAHGLPEPRPGAETTGFRLIHGEGDGLPGLIVDAYGPTLVVQLGTVGLKRLEEAVFDALMRTCDPAAIIDRTPKSIAQQEGFAPVAEGVRVVRGEAPETLTFHERGLAFALPMSLGQKTGFYFDQRPLRSRIEALAAGASVLDACCYVGAVGMAAARGGASKVWAVDTSAAAVEVGQACAAKNELAITFEAVEAAAAFRRAAADGGYDVVVCDPPKLAGRRKARDKALLSYRKLAAGAVAATKAGGLVVLCSCSAAISLEMLQRALALGARDASRRAVVVDRCFQGPDHPVVAAFPEGLYLKGVLARVDTL